jgi:hypothetical protein
MIDIYRPLMKKEPEYAFCDTPIECVSRDAVISLADSDGAFNKSFDVTVKVGVSEFTLDHHSSMGLDW